MCNMQEMSRTKTNGKPKIGVVLKFFSNVAFWWDIRRAESRVDCMLLRWLPAEAPHNRDVILVACQVAPLFH